MTSPAAPSYPLVPLSSPDALAARTPTSGYLPGRRVGRMGGTVQPCCCREYLHCSLNWVSSAARRGNARRSQVTSASPCLCLSMTLLCLADESMGSSPAVPVGALLQLQQFRFG